MTVSHSHLVALSGHLVTTLFAARYDPSLALVHFSAGAAIVPPVLSHSAHSPVQAEQVAAPEAAVFLNPTLHESHVALSVSQVPHPVAFPAHSSQFAPFGAD